MLNILKKNLEKFWKLHTNKLERNIELKNKYHNETCFIFGNGGSLKFFDFSNFREAHTFITSWGLLNHNLKNNTFNYCIIPDQYNLYPLRLNRETNKINLNYERIIWKKIIKENENTTFITSLTNYYSYLFNKRKVYYYYSTEKNTYYQNSLHNNFNYDKGSLDVMIGLAKYMGFKEAILIGCDYLGIPKLEGHFYSNKDPFIGKNVDNTYHSRINKISEGIKIKLILPSHIEGNNFNKLEDLSNFNIIESKIPSKNSELITPDDLNKLYIAGEKNKNIFV